MFAESLSLHPAAMMTCPFVLKDPPICFDDPGEEKY